MCRTHNPPRKRKCIACGKPRPARRRPKHMAALGTTYEEYLKLSGGKEVCGVCGKGPGKRKLDRDHDHKTGKPRGLLCNRCNRALPPWMTAAWLRKAAAYLDKTLPP